MGRVFNEVKFEFNVGKQALDVISFTIDEGLSTPFCGEFKLSSRKSRIEAEEMLNRTGTLKIYQNKVLTRVFSGIIQNFEKGDDVGSETRYNLTLVPSFARFSLRHNSRIFQHKSVVDILEQMLSEFHITDYKLLMMNHHAKRDYCVQYRETDICFLHRILAEEGISYSFSFTEGAHVIIFNDATLRSAKVEGDILYQPSSTAMPDKPYIKQFLFQNKLTPTTAELVDYNFLSPAFTVRSKERGIEIENQNGNYEYNDYPGRFSKSDIGKVFTKARINYLRRDASTALGSGNIAKFRPGSYFDIKGQRLDRYNKPWLLTQVRHTGKQSQSLEELSSNGEASYSNEFSVLPLHVPWTPAPEPKPEVGGPHVAVVKGPEGEEIYVDEYGRVKVLFKWDRIQTPTPRDDSERTCWIRASDGWAGARRGMVALPRVGDEVLVSFLEGDPDRPIITGRTYHAHNLQPFELPTRKTVTGLKTKTHKGNGYNELSFDDENEQQLIHIHAEKDFDIKVKNIKSERIDVDHTVSIGNDETIFVEKEQKLTVGVDRKKIIGQDEEVDIGRDSKSRISQDLFSTIGRNEDRKVLSNKREAITADNFLTIGGNEEISIEGIQSLVVKTKMKTYTNVYELTGADTIIIKGPSGKIVFDSTGITLEAPQLNLKGSVNISGGGADQVERLQAAIEEGFPFVEECSKKGGE